MWDQCICRLLWIKRAVRIWRGLHLLTFHPVSRRGISSQSHSLCTSSDYTLVSTPLGGSQNFKNVIFNHLKICQSASCTEHDCLTKVHNLSTSLHFYPLGSMSSSPKRSWSQLWPCRKSTSFTFILTFSPKELISHNGVDVQRSRESTTHIPSITFI